MNPDKGIYRVGGCVRDRILGKEPKDFDYVVVGYTVEEFLRKFPKAQLMGKSFPVFNVAGDGEYAFARTERKMGLGHGAFEVVADPSIRLIEDLARRDLTINALAADDDGKVIDYFGGQKDLEDGILRHVGPAFVEDPLRVYRLARFQAQLRHKTLRSTFTVAPVTMEVARSISDDELYSLSGERVGEETRRAMRSDKPGIFFHTLKELGKLHIWHKELADLVDVPAGPPEFHGEKDSFVHTQLTLNHFNVPATTYTGDLEVARWAALLHDLGKGVTTREKWPSHPGHDEAGVPLVEALCARLRLPNYITKSAVLACKEHMRVHLFLEMRKGKWVDLVQAGEKTALGARGLAEVCIADTHGRHMQPNADGEVFYDTRGPEALAAVVEAVKEEKGHPIPASLTGEHIGLHVRACKGAAAKRKLKELGLK